MPHQYRYTDATSYTAATDGYVPLHSASFGLQARVRKFPVAHRLPLAHRDPEVVSAFWCYIEFTFHANALLNTGQLKPFITSTISITLALNLIATCILGLSYLSMNLADL